MAREPVLCAIIVFYALGGARFAMGQADHKAVDLASLEVRDIAVVRDGYIRNRNRYDNFETYGLFDSKFESQGREEIVRGRFKWTVSNGRFSFRSAILGQSGCSEILERILTEATYHVIGDGKSVLAASFHPRIAVDSDAQIWNAGDAGYLSRYLNRLPVRPDGKNDNLFGPSKLPEKLRVLRRVEGGLLRGQYVDLDVRESYLFQSLENTGIRSAYRFCGLSAKWNDIVLASSSIIYRQAPESGPKQIRTSRSNSDGSARWHQTIHFSKFNFAPEIGPNTFAVEGIDFGPAAKIVDKRSQDELVLQAPRDGFSSHGDTLAETFEFYRRDVEAKHVKDVTTPLEE